MPHFEQQLNQQSFGNGYLLIDGVAMHAENGDQFQVPHPVLKKYVATGHYVEVRIDSPRFSVHEDAPEKCTCETCNGEMTKPVLSHQHPATLVPLPPQDVPSRGWGEDFWVRVVEREHKFFCGVIDNPLHETPLHQLQRGSEIYFHENNILAVHASHREEMVLGMKRPDVFKLVEWLEQHPDQ